jgi:hypothetical protein
MTCPACVEWARQHKKAIRWIAFFIALAAGLTILGRFSEPVNAPGFCLVYP